MQYLPYTRFAYAISVIPEGQGGGRSLPWTVLNEACQTCRDDLLVRNPLKILAVQETCSRSFGWTRENILECVHTNRDIEWQIIWRTSKRMSTGISGNIDNLAFLRHLSSLFFLVRFSVFLPLVLVDLARFVPRVFPACVAGSSYSPPTSEGASSSAIFRDFTGCRVETITTDDGGGGGGG